MRFPSVQLFIAILAIPLNAMADDFGCSSIPESQQYGLSGCECGKSLSKLPIKSPQGMSLMASCGYKKVEFVGTVGGFYFKGKATVNGEVRRINSPIFGDSVWFDTKRTGKPSEFSGALQAMKFKNNPVAIEQFKTPPLSEESPCWAADATLGVSLLYVHAGYESDEDGSYPKEFQVLKVGQYRPCQIEEDGNEEFAIHRKSLIHAVRGDAKLRIPS